MPRKGPRAGSRLQRQQAEQQQLRRKEELLTLFLRDKLQKEERNSLVNRQKLRAAWQTLARQARSQELRDDVITLQQDSDRQLDHLDSVIKGLERELREAERQVACGRRLHLQNLQRLRRLQEQCAAAVQRRWQSCLESLRRRFLSERWERRPPRGRLPTSGPALCFLLRSHIVAQCLLKEADWEDVRFALEQKHRAEKEELHQLYGESMAVLEVARQEQVEAWRLALPAAPQPGPVSLQAAVLAQSNFEMLNDKIRQNQEAKQQQDSESKGPERKGQRVVTVKNTCKKKLKTEVSDLQQKIGSMELENILLTERLSAVDHHLPTLRRRLLRDRQAAQKKLKELAVVSDSVSRRLKSAVAMGEKVLAALESCQKLQPEEPKADVKVLLRRELLQEQRELLRQENQHLRTVLRQRLDSMTLSHHALLVIGAAPTTAAPTEPARRHTVIEAALAVRNAL
ncbi:dynein regulatory complex subunit 2-like isoform X1 [Synchiropus splendidus]|uniref:dynein regulatory complex subunit 2-like isoform X1 n=1 Tax=Synchiropus splendidus TaxID=270530 RepID=UPI00237E3CB7|nr:dynein regulatory complex subunit 2-like isoform X1 [Synchiropus splendidus]